MGTWSTGIGKFKKKDPNHGWLLKWLKDNWKAFWKAEAFLSWKRYRKNKCCSSCKRKKEGE
jgi:hypothetical protein